MAINKRSEQALLSHEEWSVVQLTHRPEIGLQKPEDLRDARKTLRNWRDKERDLKSRVRQAARGKADERGGSFPGTYERPAKRRQVFAHALRRVNDELTRREGSASRRRIIEPQLAVLATKKKAEQNKAAAGGHLHERAIKPTSVNTRNEDILNRAKVGSVTKQTARSQAKKDG